MNETEKNIDDLYICPINMDRIKAPVVLPSGNTVESQVMEDLIKKGDKKGGKDPFDRTKRFRAITRNLFAIRIGEVMEVHKKKKKDLPAVEL